MSQELPAVVSAWIIDDNKTYLDLIVSGLSLDGRIEVRGFQSCKQAIGALKKVNRKPQVILLDIDMPGMDGITAIPHLKSLAGQTKVIMLTVSGSRDVICKALRAGAYGYVQKSAGLEETIAAVMDATEGKRHLDKSSVTLLLDGLYPSDTVKPACHLTRREEDVLALLTAGLNRRQVSDRIGIGEGTVITYVSSLYRKLGVHKLSGAVRRALEESIISDDKGVAASEGQAVVANPGGGKTPLVIL